MPRYAFIVKALSPRDGGWVRLPRWPAVPMGGNQYIVFHSERTIVF